MAELKNPALDKLRAGELSIGVGLRQARTVDIAKIMKTAGFDWLFIDMDITPWTWIWRYKSASPLMKPVLHP